MIKLPFTNDAITLGILLIVLGTIMHTSRSRNRFFLRFYRFVPALVLCYFMPALLHWPIGLISSEESQLYYVASRYLLPASLVLLCLNVDIPAILGLGKKAIIMFFTATLGIVLGGPISVLIILSFFPGLVPGDPENLWRGLSTIAGSWIGGGANQTAMKEIYEVSDSLFATMVIVDILIGNTWLGILLYGVNHKERIDAWLASDRSAINQLEKRVADYKEKVTRTMTTTDVYAIMGVAFGATGLAHLGADLLVPLLESSASTIKELRLNSLLSPFFWIVVISTSIGIGLSFSKARRLEGVGASSFGSFFIYFLVATIGMKMNVLDIVKNPGLFAIGALWMTIHITSLIVIAKWIKAPYFFIAVGSTANVGGAASAPVVANAFSPTLAPVGALLAVLGYAAGTYGAILCATLMELASN
ncbi:MAG: DUF819 family protein [Bacteroidota bacterium]